MWFDDHIHSSRRIVPSILIWIFMKWFGWWKSNIFDILPPGCRRCSPPPSPGSPAPPSGTSPPPLPGILRYQLEHIEGVESRKWEIIKRSRQQKQFNINRYFLILDAVVMASQLLATTSLSLSTTGASSFSSTNWLLLDHPSCTLALFPR